MHIGNWVTSAAVVGGVAGGSVIGLSSGSTPAADANHKVVQPAPATPSVAELQREVDALVADDKALRRAVAAARSHLAGQVRASEASLRALRQRLASAQAALAAAQAARPIAPAPASRQVTTAVSPAPAARPTTHASTGASGASGTTSGDDGGDGGHDD